MKSIHEFYDSMADISLLTGEAINTLGMVREKIKLALSEVSNAKKYGSDTPISPVSNVTINDVHRNLLFLELLLNQTYGVANTLTFEELLGLAYYYISEEEP